MTQITSDLQNFALSFLSDKKRYSITKGRKVAYNSFNLIERIIPDRISDVLNTDDYKVYGSAGIGAISEIPWFGVFDKEITLSATEGYYIVYLFRSDMKGFYLSLNQGWTQYKDRYKKDDNFNNINKTKRAKEEIKDNAKLAQEILKSTQGFSFEDINLCAKNQNGKGYELGNIVSKYYSINSLHEDDRLFNDLNYMIGVYRELKGTVGEYIFNIENLSEDKNAVTANNIDEETPSEAGERKSALITGNKAEEIFEKKALSHYGWKVINKSTTFNLGYDFLCENPELFIEVKGCLEEIDSIRLTEREWEVAEQRRANYILAIVYNINKEPDIEIIKDPYKHFKDLIKRRPRIVTSLHITGKDIRSFTSLQ